jgi:hypothetical protein
MCCNDQNAHALLVSTLALNRRVTLISVGGSCTGGNIRMIGVETTITPIITPSEYLEFLDRVMSNIKNVL